MLLFLDPDDQTSVLPSHSNWVLLRARPGFDKQVHYSLHGAVRSWPYLLFLPEPFTILTCSWLFSNMVEVINLGQLRTIPASCLCKSFLSYTTVLFLVSWKFPYCTLMLSLFCLLTFCLPALPAGIICASLALGEAGIEMYDLVSSCSLVRSVNYELKCSKGNEIVCQ